MVAVIPVIESLAAARILPSFVRQDESQTCRKIQDDISRHRMRHRPARDFYRYTIEDSRL